MSDWVQLIEHIDGKDWERIFGQEEAVEFLDNDKVYCQDKSGNDVTGKEIKDAFGQRYDRIDWSK